VLDRFRTTWPAVRVELSERQDDRDLFELVAAGALDLTFGVEGAERGGAFDRVHLIDDPYVLLAPPTSRFIGRESVDVRELDGEDLIAHQSTGTCDYVLRGMWREAAVSPNVVFRTDDNLTCQRLVGTGLGHAVVPELTVERGLGAGPAVVIPLARPLIRPIALFWQADRYRSPVARAFVETASAVCAEGAPEQEELGREAVLQ
jgi:DNA-binding transcriptional LysR family regulator